MRGTKVEAGKTLQDSCYSKSETMEMQPRELRREINSKYVFPGALIGHIAGLGKVCVSVKMLLNTSYTESN